MRSILPRFLPDSTTTLPGFSRSIRSTKSGLAWTSSRQLVGRSARALKARHAAEVQQQVGADRCEHVHRRVDARVHLLLDQRGVKVAGIERHQAHRRVLGRDAHRGAQAERQQKTLAAHALTSRLFTTA